MTALRSLTEMLKRSRAFSLVTISFFDCPTSPFAASNLETIPNFHRGLETFLPWSNTLGQWVHVKIVTVLGVSMRVNGIPMCCLFDEPPTSMRQSSNTDTLYLSLVLIV